MKITINTKFDAGDTIFFMEDNQIKTMLIADIYINKFDIKRKPVITYYNHFGRGVNQSQAFSSKTELLNSL